MWCCGAEDMAGSGAAWDPAALSILRPTETQGAIGTKTEVN